MSDNIANQLIESSLISQDQLELALSEQGQSGGSLGYNLVKTGAISEKAFSEFLSQQYQVPAVDLDELEADEHSVELIPSEVATKFQVVRKFFKNFSSIKTLLKRNYFCNTLDCINCMGRKLSGSFSGF